jgi:hypothetical protein
VVATGSPAEAANYLREATEDRAIALKHPSGPSDGTRLVEGTAHDLFVDFGSKIDPTRDLCLSAASRAVILFPGTAHQSRVTNAFVGSRETAYRCFAMCLAGLWRGVSTSMQHARPDF